MINILIFKSKGTFSSILPTFRYHLFSQKPLYLSLFDLMEQSPKFMNLEINFNSLLATNMPT